MKDQTFKIIVLTTLALIAFAANSVLCRLALGGKTIDASGFTSVRLLSGALVLYLIISLGKNKTSPTKNGSWFSAIMLFLYAITFSYAYISLDTGTGALILFGAVQITMILLSIYYGNRLHFTEWIGVIIAFTGFVYLLLPGVHMPSIRGFILMTLAGIAWGFYTVHGRASTNPVRDTAYNFLKTIPLVLILIAITFKQVNYSTEGIVLAMVSGGITSGIGYTIWYMALRGLSSVQAAVLQLLVPIIAAFGGVLFISEKITLRLTTASLLILGGILMVLLGKKFQTKTDKS